MGSNPVLTAKIKFNNMKGIYLTLEGKQEIEAKIAELLNYLNDEDNIPIEQEWTLRGVRSSLQEILASATILPVDNNYVSSKYPNGVIIQPKQ